MWQRGDTYFTDWIPTSNFIAYMLTNCIGFCYVNHVTLRRESFFKSQNNDSWDLFATCFIISPGMFFMSVIPTWHSKHSTDLLECPYSMLEGDCSQNNS